MTLVSQSFGRSPLSLVVEFGTQSYVAAALVSVCFSLSATLTSVSVMIAIKKHNIHQKLAACFGAELKESDWILRKWPSMNSLMKHSGSQKHELQVTCFHS